MTKITKHNLLILVMIVTILLPLLGVPLPKTASTVNLALYGSSLLGYLGINMILWQTMLGTRSVSGLLFNDLPRKISVHRWLGTYGIILVFIHPVLSMIGYSENLLYLILPSLNTEFAQHVTYGRIAIWGMLLIWISSAILRGKIAYRPWKYIHYIAYPVLGFSLLHIYGTATSLNSIGMKVYWVILVVLSLTSVVLRMRHLFGYSKHSYTVASNTSLTSDVWLIRLRPLGSKLKNLSAGQYVYLQLSLKGEEHPFSILDYDNTTGDILIAFKVYGSFTKKLSRVTQEAPIIIDGPYGDFSHKENSSPSVFIAGGIGITPFVKTLLNSNGKDDLLFYSNKTPATSALRDKLKSALGNRCIEIFSQPYDNQIAPMAENGRLNKAMITKYISNPPSYNYYLCGPKGLVVSTQRYLSELGVPKSQIHSELFEF